MIYIFIDESGDSGLIDELGTTSDFAMAACICYTENIELLNTKISKFRSRIKKKEIKFSKLSSKEMRLTKEFFGSLKIEHVTTCTEKTNYEHSRDLLHDTFENLISKIKITKKENITVFIDGTENAYFRKIYEPIIRKKFSRVTLKFANSMKTPMIQAADFYAGYMRRFKR